MRNHTHNVCVHTPPHTHTHTHTQPQASTVDMITIWLVQIKSIGKRCGQDWHLCATYRHVNSGDLSGEARKAQPTQHFEVKMGKGRLNVNKIPSYIYK